MKFEFKVWHFLVSIAVSYGGGMGTMCGIADESPEEAAGRLAAQATEQAEERQEQVREQCEGWCKSYWPGADRWRVSSWVKTSTAASACQCALNVDDDSLTFRRAEFTMPGYEMKETPQCNAQ